MNADIDKTTQVKQRPQSTGRQAREAAYGYPRNSLGHQFVYVVVSPRARGLSVGINFNPDRFCNFDCVYCEVDRSQPSTVRELDVDKMSKEFAQTLEFVQSGRLRDIPEYRKLPPELLTLRHVTLSGDGEPTLSPVFATALQAVIHLRALDRRPYFKIVLVTNGSGLDRPEVREGLKYLVQTDEIWVKLDAGTVDWMSRINRPQVDLEKILSNILLIAKGRPVVIQSLFTSLNGVEPPVSEIQRYAQRLLELKRAGANIAGIQIYSATRPTPHSECGHLSLRSLSKIAQAVRNTAGLPTDVF
jgi:wyosine [tRNA(Phe)-imidazoG37] synthetase (radical SAM superfamily)